VCRSDGEARPADARQFVNDPGTAAERESLKAEDRQVILCERGIGSFDTETRNLLGLSAIPLGKASSHLPITADPSHGTGVLGKVLPMARVAGADGLIAEVHPSPDVALFDGGQSPWPNQFDELVGQVQGVTAALARKQVREPARV
jgi:3-deoxy-7-phosphoheptulonate synthase